MVLNEIMYDPDGNESDDEFIELYNSSSTHEDLSGWTISDGEGVDTIISLNQGLIVGPREYVLILDPDYFEDGSTTYDGLVPEDALVVTISGSNFGRWGLSNSTAKILSLIDGSGDTLATYTYSLGNVEGRSDEKILMSAGDEPTNWADAIQLHGSPGARNSVTPPEHDLSITEFAAMPDAPQTGESFDLIVTVENLGLNSRSDSVLLYERLEGMPLQPLSGWQTPLLAPGDSAIYQESDLIASAAPRVFVAQLRTSDDGPENNSRVLIVSSAGSAGGVVINEIMYSPETGMSEWIELLNTTVSTISLNGWSFGDGTSLMDSSRRTTLSSILIAPDSLIVLASDSTIYFEHLPATAQIYVWNSSNISLNNNGDSLVLWDAQRVISDRVDYRPSWGGAQGISLERVSALAISNDELNWASSLDSTGCTPARTNSRALPQQGASGNVLVLAPNPFSPDNDGHDDLLVVRYSLTHSDSRIDLKIYNVRGREVRRLASNAAAGYAGEILWDGRDDRGRDLPTGMYIIYLEALGRGGSRIESARRVAVLARPS